MTEGQALQCCTIWANPQRQFSRKQGENNRTYLTISSGATEKSRVTTEAAETSEVIKSTEITGYRGNRGSRVDSIQWVVMVQGQGGLDSLLSCLETMRS
jgi:hypothetical protein